MSHSPSGHGPRPRSPSSQGHRRGHTSLSIWTTSQQPQQAIQPFEDRLPIPFEKQDKARKLYQEYLRKADSELMKSELEHRQDGHQSATSHYSSHLEVPGHSLATVSSSFSRRDRAASVSSAASTQETLTEFGSVLSFDDKEATSTKAKGALLSFDGSSVKSARTRRRFTPAKKLKTALIRYVGSCPTCQPRKVPCSLEHHDFEGLLQLPTTSKHKTQSHYQQLDFLTTLSQHIKTSLEEDESLLGLSQDTDLAGIGDRYSLAGQEPIATTLDIQSPESYGFTRMPGFASVEFTPRTPAPELSTSANYKYQDGGLFALGFLLGTIYVCQHSDADITCDQMFGTDEELQQHFSIFHFEFTRIDPAHRYVCSQCKHFNNDWVNLCYNCGEQDSIQIWLYGHYIRTTNFSRHAPDGQDLRHLDNYTTYIPPMPNIAWNLDPSLDNNTGFGQFNMQDGNLYGGPRNQSYDFNSSGEAETGGNQFTSNNYGGAHQFALGFTRMARLGFLKSRKLITRCKISVLLFSLVAILSSGFLLRWTVCKVEARYRNLSYHFEAQLPIVGFMVFLASFAVSLLAKHLWDKHLRRQSTYRRLHSLTITSPSKCRPSGFDNRVYIR